MHFFEKENIVLNNDESRTDARADGGRNGGAVADADACADAAAAHWRANAGVRRRRVRRAAAHLSTATRAGARRVRDARVM